MAKCGSILPYTRCWSHLSRTLHERDKRGDSSMTFDWMPKRKIGFDTIVVPPSQMYPLDVSGLFQVRDNPLDGTLGDAYHQGYFPHPNLGLTG